MENIAFLRGWLRGFFDGEGCVSYLLKENGYKQTSVRLYVGNTDQSLIDTCKNALDRLGIEYSYRLRPSKPPRKRLGLIYISKHESLLRFAKIVGFSSIAKTKIMKDGVDYIRSRQAPTYSAALLRNLYVKRKMSLPDICRHFGKHSKQQWYFSKLMKDYGIPLRSKSEGLRIAFAKRARLRSASVERRKTSQERNLEQPKISSS